MERKLASIRTISDIKPIENADSICVYRIDGWNVVDQISKYNIGDKVVYFEIDSWIPTTIAPFLSKDKQPKQYNGTFGERLRTIKLRGQISQGLIVSLDSVGVDVNTPTGEDVTSLLNIQKYEPPIAANLAGSIEGSFPTSLMSKTDQERIQNIFDDVKDSKETFEITIKLDGSSCTIFKHQGKLRVCSRNLELKINDENSSNAFVKMAKQLESKLELLDNIAFQGELMGPGIQGNRENFSELRFFVFDIIDLESRMSLIPAGRRYLTTILGMDHVPVIEDEGTVPKSVEDALQMSEGASINNKVREGLVWKSNESEVSFKAISNNFLLKTNS